MNELGTPNLSQFATYAYSAGAHLDSDDSHTVGRVFRRSPEVGSMPLAISNTRSETYILLPIMYRSQLMSRISIMHRTTCWWNWRKVCSGCGMRLRTITAPPSTGFSSGSLQSGVRMLKIFQMQRSGQWCQSSQQRWAELLEQRRRRWGWLSS